MSPATTVTIRLAYDADAAAQARLAALDEAPPLSGDNLVAGAEGTIVAALSIDDAPAERAR
jgi:hypothetical protein